MAHLNGLLATHDAFSFDQQGATAAWAVVGQLVANLMAILVADTVALKRATALAAKVAARMRRLGLFTD
jgi:hypothetical protein